ncbi:MAG: hypothetical protein ABEJ98_00195 [Candidatus Nanohaloarchaea archaeon]
MDFKTYFDRIYEDYTKYFVVPLAMIVVALGVLGFNYMNHPEGVFSQGLDFKGGIEVVYSAGGNFTASGIEQAFAAEGRGGVEAVRQSNVGSDGPGLVSVQVPRPVMSVEEVDSIVKTTGLTGERQDSRKLSPMISQSFRTQAPIAFVLAFTIMSLMIFVAFRDLTPSLAVIFAAAGDILIALAGMSFFRIKLTMGSVAALLMLIGYSVDTDIVLSSRVLEQRKESLRERIWSSVKTGVTMSSGGIAAFSILYIVSMQIVGPSELSNIAAVMVIGLLADMPFTYFGNAIILKEYREGDLNIYEKLKRWLGWD